MEIDIEKIQKGKCDLENAIRVYESILNDLNIFQQIMYDVKRHIDNNSWLLIDFGYEKLYQHIYKLGGGIINENDHLCFDYFYDKSVTICSDSQVKYAEEKGVSTLSNVLLAKYNISFVTESDMKQILEHNIK